MQISDTAVIKTGLACSKTGFTVAKQPFACWRYSCEQINSKRRMAMEGQVSDSSRSKYTLTDGSVEQYPRHRQSTLTYRPCSTLPKIEAIAYTRKRQAKQPCLDTDGATESNGCSSSLRMDDIHVGL